MKNITLSDEDAKINELRRLAEYNQTTVNELFRQWAAAYIKKERSARLKAFHQTLKLTDYVKLDRTYTRAEMNER